MTEDPGSTRDFICFSIFDWWNQTHAHSDFQLMLHLAETRRVLFVNSIGMRMPRRGQTPRIARRALRKLRSTMKLLRRPLRRLPGFYVLSPLSLPLYNSPRGRAWNARFVRWQVGLAARWARIRKPIHFLTVPTSWEIVAPTQPEFIVYNRSDKHSSFTEGNREYLAKLESELLDRADLVLYVNQRLLEEETELVGERGYFIDHGVDPDRFRPNLPIAPEMAALPRPRIGFFGDLRKRLVDFDLLSMVAEKIPTATLVLLGNPSDPIDELIRHPNVHWLGEKDHGEIAAYGAGLDVGLLPYRLTEWVQRSNPIKTKEYLALGLPVVSTDFPAARSLEGTIEVADGPEDFVARVERVALTSLGEPDSAKLKRHELVRNGSWASKADELLQQCSIRWSAATAGPERDRTTHR